MQILKEIWEKDKSKRVISKNVLCLSKNDQNEL